jgi:hypothetical protein
MRAPVDESSAKLQLQPAQLPGDCRLRNTLFHRNGGERAGISYPQKGAQSCNQIHGHPGVISDMKRS